MIRIFSIIIAVLVLSACTNSGTEKAENKPVPTTAPVTKEEKPAPKESAEPVTARATAQSEQPKPEQPKPEQQVSAPSASTPSKPAASGPTEEQIKQKYHAELIQLQSYYVGKLSGLYGQALQDVKAGKSAKTLYGQYAKQAGSISEESHAKVNQVLAKMKAELLANNLPVSGVDQYRSVYHQEIGRAKGDTMQKLKAAVGY